MFYVIYLHNFSEHKNTTIFISFPYTFLLFGILRLSGLENGLLGLSSRVNAVLWSRSSPDIESIDVVCFGHLLFEMCTGYELSEPVPSRAHLTLDLERYPQVSSPN
jgi:hypothetical protein